MKRLKPSASEEPYFQCINNNHIIAERNGVS